MYPTLLDLKTGRSATADNFDCSIFWWEMGNGSCDCNRAICIGRDVDFELEQQFGEGSCYGCHRIVVIDVHGDLEGMTKEEAISHLNSGYTKLFSATELWKIETAEHAKWYLKALHAEGLMYHFDDDPQDCLGRVLGDHEIQAIKSNITAVFETLDDPYSYALEIVFNTAPETTNSPSFSPDRYKKG